MLKKVVTGFVVVSLLFVVGVLIAQKVSDGPMGPLQGGPFKTGEIVPGPIDDWSFVEQANGLPEILLVAPGTSRITGLMVYKGELYIPCDLGFMANRSWDDAATQWFSIAMSVLKNWHKDAVEDGRAVIRLDGKRYGAQLTKVPDPDLTAELRLWLEQIAKEAGGLDKLPPRPTEEPNDIWFFHVAPRAV